MRPTPVFKRSLKTLLFQTPYSGISLLNWKSVMRRRCSGRRRTKSTVDYDYDMINWKPCSLSCILLHFCVFYHVAVNLCEYLLCFLDHVAWNKLNWNWIDNCRDGPDIVLDKWVSEWVEFNAPPVVLYSRLWMYCTVINDCRTEMRLNSILWSGCPLVDYFKCTSST